MLKGATILLGIKQSEISCTIRNMHDHGAEIRLPPSTYVPDSFLLYVPTDGTGYRCSLRWRIGNQIGVQFMGKEPKPHWHYGM